MARKCKVCNLPEPLRVEVNKNLMGGSSWQEISNFLEEKQVMITHTSVGRHAKSHIEEYCERFGYDKPHDKNSAYSINSASDSKDTMPTTHEIDVKKIKKRLGLDGEFSTPEIALTQMKQLMFKLLFNQGLIVTDLQERFMEGNGRFPETEIKTMKTLADMLAVMSDKINPEKLGDMESEDKQEKG